MLRLNFGKFQPSLDIREAKPTHVLGPREWFHMYNVFTHNSGWWLSVRRLKVYTTCGFDKSYSPSVRFSFASSHLNIVFLLTLANKKYQSSNMQSNTNSSTVIKIKPKVKITIEKIHRCTTFTTPFPISCTVRALLQVDFSFFHFFYLLERKQNWYISRVLMSYI